MLSNRDPRIKIGENLFLNRRIKEIERNFLVRFFDFLFEDCEANTLLFNDRTKKIINSYEERKYFRQVNSTVYSLLISDRARAYFDVTLSSNFFLIHALFPALSFYHKYAIARTFTPLFFFSLSN